MTNHAVLTVNETAILSGAPKSTVEKAIERGVIALERPGGTAVSGQGGRLPVGAVSYFAAVKGADLDWLPAGRKREIWRAIRANPLRRAQIAKGLTLDLECVAGEIYQRALDYVADRDRLIVRDEAILGGTPVLAGTRLSVHAIAGRLADGDTLDDLVSDYPDIPRRAFEVAALFARANPLRGRPAGKPWRQSAPG